jgi:hypothetical protein
VGIAESVALHGVSYDFANTRSGLFWNPARDNRAIVVRSDCRFGSVRREESLSFWQRRMVSLAVKSPKIAENPGVAGLALEEVESARSLLPMDSRKRITGLRSTGRRPYR